MEEAFCMQIFMTAFKYLTRKNLSYIKMNKGLTRTYDAFAHQERSMPWEK